MKRTRTYHSAFTLIELLVVIAIIALLLSIVMPALRRAKEAGKRAVCLANTRSLTTGWLLYVQENDGRLPKGYTANDGWIRAVPGNIWEKVTYVEQRAALENGLLYPYLGTLDIFRCPVANEDEIRTYSMTHAMNGGLFAENYGGKVLTRFNQINNTADRIVFLDDYMSDWDACWFVYNDQERWWNATPIRHGAGGNVFSFADGHSEFWSWKDARTIKLAKKCAEARTPDAATYPESIQPGNEDLTRIQRAVWGKLGY